MLATSSASTIVAIRAVVEPVDARPVAAQEADERRLVSRRPAPPRGADGALVGAERLGGGEHGEAALAREQLERRAQQRRVVLAGKQIAVAVRVPPART